MGANARALRPPVDSYVPTSCTSPASCSSFTFCSTVGQLRFSRWASSGWEMRSQSNMQRMVLMRLIRLTSMLLARLRVMGIPPVL